MNDWFGPLPGQKQAPDPPLWRLRWSLYRCSDRFADWLRSRDLSLLLRAFPAILVAIVAAVLYLCTTFTSNADLAKRYAQRGAWATSNEDYLTARTCYERLIRLRRERPEDQFRLALAAAALGQQDYATVILGKLAPLDHRGYPRAHLHLAKNLLDNPSVSPEDRRLAEQHLLLIRPAPAPPPKADPGSSLAEAPKSGNAETLLAIDALTALAKSYMATDRFNEAEEALLQTLTYETPAELLDMMLTARMQPITLPESHTLLGKLYMRWDKPAKAQPHLGHAATNTPMDDPRWLDLQILLAQANLANHEAGEAMSILHKAIEARGPDQTKAFEAHALLGKIYLTVSRPREAEEHLVKATSSPGPDAAWLAEARVYLAQLHVNARRHTEAEGLLLQALESAAMEPAVRAAAHALLGRLYLATGRKDEAERHLLVAVEKSAADSRTADEARALLGQLYQITGRAAAAEQNLTKVVETRPEVGLALARILLARGKKVDATDEAKRALSFFRDKAEAELTDQAARLNWSDASTFLGEFADAVTQLQAGLRGVQALPYLNLGRGDFAAAALACQRLVTDPQEEAYRKALARTYTAWLTAVEQKPNANLTERFRLVEQVLQYEPGSLAVLSRLANNARLTGTEADKLRKEAEALLENKKAPVLSRLVIGLCDLESGKEQAARQRFREALELAPQTAVALNNLAWIFAQVPPANLKKALAVIDAALERWPDQPNFRDTRGQVLAKLDRWQEARADLEAALPRLRNKQNTHLTLAQTYQHLGQPEKAAEHQELAAQKVD